MVEVRGSGGFRRPGEVVPGGEAVGHLDAIVIGGEPMAAGPEVRGDHAEHHRIAVQLEAPASAICPGAGSSAQVQGGRRRNLAK